MIEYDEAVLALLDQGRMNVRGLVRFELGTGTYGFINSVQPLIYGGLTYQPGGLIEVSDLSEDTNLTAQGFTITLAESPDDGLTPDVLKTIEMEDYRDRPVKLFDAQFHPDTGALITVQLLKRGYVDTIEHIVSKDRGYCLVANCESRALDYTRTNARFRTDLDQRRRNASDGFFLHSSTRGREQIYWGKQKPTSPSANIGTKGFPDGPK
jgi:hypothetical protein